MVDRPVGMFDREFEWAELARFAGFDQPGATLGVVSGRRRQGKTFLLDEMARATGGFYFTGTEATEAEALRQFGAALAEFRGEPTPLRFAGWDEAITALMRIAPDRPVLAVLDEFPYLAKAAPSLPSIIQRALDPAAQRNNTRVRLLLCGSAMSFMGRLLSGNAPLRGRAGLELVVPTLDFRLAARFWEVDHEPSLAVLTNSVVGGTPAYRRQFTQGDAPADLADFDSWVIRAVLNPSRPLFREARYLLAEEPELRDTALYHSVLAAIASGNTTRGGIANFLGRKSTDLGHPLGVLEDVGMIAHEPNLFRANRSAYRITEPLLTFHHAIMRPFWTELERPERAAGVWARAGATFASRVLGPRFEFLCREWLRWYAGPETVGGVITEVGGGELNDKSERAKFEVDVAAVGLREDGRSGTLTLGEAKWSTTMTTEHLRRLRRIKRVLREHPQVPTDERTRLMLFTAGGFSEELVAEAAASDGEVRLVPVGDLYAD